MTALDQVREALRKIAEHEVRSAAPSTCDWHCTATARDDAYEALAALDAFEAELLKPLVEAATEVARFDSGGGVRRIQALRAALALLDGKLQG